MIALLLVVALFLYLTWVGQAVISLLRPRLGILWSWLIAPTVGLALIVTIITHLNVWGWPVKAFGPWLTIGLFVGAAAVLAWRRPRLPWRQLLPFLLIACGSLIYFGWPLLGFGFNWVSYGNDDMTNYTLAADRFLNHGYYDVPALSAIKGRDFTQTYWFLHAVDQIRSGADLTIAWVASITGLNVHQVYMPAILMLGLLQLFALGALATIRGRHRRIALVAFFLLAISPLFGLGALYQLIAQVGGLALFLATASLLVSTNFASLRKILLASLLTCALCMFYPETTPFLALGILLFSTRLIWTKKANFKHYIVFLIATGLIALLLLGTNIFEYFTTLLNQTALANNSAAKVSVFPWTLVPSYLPMILGLHSYGVVGNDPLLSIQIAAGLILAGYTLRSIWRSMVSDSPAGYLGVVMVLLGTDLYIVKNDFGLFKLAMYAQPILALCVAEDFLRYISGKNPAIQRAARWALAVFFACTLPVAFNYTYSSLGKQGGGLAEIVDASQQGVKFTPPADLHYDSIDCDVSNVVTAKMLMLYTKNIDTYFLSRDFLTNIKSFSLPPILRDKEAGQFSPRNTFFLRLFFPAKFLQSQAPQYLSPVIAAANNNWLNMGSQYPDPNSTLFIALRKDLDGFNKLDPDSGWRVQNVYQYKLESQVNNRLVFINSKLGQHYFLSDRVHVAIYQREPDPTMPDTVSFHGTGHYNVFEIINPSSNFRMVLDFTCSPLGADRCQLPKNASVVGVEKYSLPFVGRGSARIISLPMSPEFLQHIAYLTLDFGQDGQPFITPKTGLMRLYGVERSLDDRHLVGYTRDISLLTEEQYRALPRPASISRFPEDLMQYAGLEYSGLSEDGWISSDCYCKLGPSHPGQVLLFRGFVPTLPKFASEGIDLTLSINGKSSGTVHLMPGEFTLSWPINETSDITSAAFHFSDAQICDPKKDHRLVSAFVHEIAINDAPNPATVPPPSNQSGEKPDRTGVDSDGWIDRTAIFKTPAFPEFKVLKLSLEMPGWSSLTNNGLKVFLNDRLVQAAVVPRGTDQALYVPLAAGAPAEVRLESATTFALPNEKRERCFLLKSFSFESPTQADLFTHGWHKSGYFFLIDHADADGWVDRQVAFRFPATAQFKTAIVEIVRFPGKLDLSLAVSVNHAPPVAHILGLEQTEHLRIPLSGAADTMATLATEDSFPLAAPDTRERSFRIVNIDFE